MHVCYGVCRFALLLDLNIFYIFSAKIGGKEHGTLGVRGRTRKDQKKKKDMLEF